MTTKIASLTVLSSASAAHCCLFNELSLASNYWNADGDSCNLEWVSCASKNACAALSLASNYWNTTVHTAWLSWNKMETESHVALQRLIWNTTELSVQYCQLILLWVINVLMQRHMHLHTHTGTRTHTHTHTHTGTHTHMGTHTHTHTHTHRHTHTHNTHTPITVALTVHAVEG